MLFNLTIKTVNENCICAQLIKISTLLLEYKIGAAYSLKT